MDLEQDRQIRLAAFDWLSKQVDLHGQVLPRSLLQRGFQSCGERIPLMSPQGIFKPAVMSLPLTITTVYSGPYDDTYTSDGLLAYKYRGTDPRHPDNVGLRTLMERGIPLVYFHAILKGKYVAAWPVYVVGDLPQSLTFTVALDDDRYSLGSIEDRAEGEVGEAGELARRIYVTSTFRRRLHQQSFRERVLRAYREQCALCRLRHVELLDAAHIIPDADPEGEPSVTNGLALCKLHHAAFDRHFLGITPDYTVEVRADILDEEDGPMLRYGLQGLHRQRILYPSSKSARPDRRFLERRYELFRSAKQ